MDFANGSRMSDPWAAAIYAAATARGGRHPHAIRILARALRSQDSGSRDRLSAW